jgi:sirohydrochlorin cobaltochelatase
LGTTQSTNACGFLVVGHGTRNPLGQHQMQQLFKRMTDRCAQSNLAEFPTEYAFLELAEPGIQSAIERLADAGVREIIVVPVLLFAAGHANSDIPAEVSIQAEKLGIRIRTQSRPLCCDPSVVELSAQRFHQALKAFAGRAIHMDQVALAMIGRGSSSTEATEAMLQFSELRNRMCPVGWSTTGFIHAQRPSVDEALDGLAATGLPWLVVQPHLLFEGKLMDDLREEVTYRQSFSDYQKWIITEPLGPETLIADVLCRLSSQIDKDQFDAERLSDCRGSCQRCGMARQYC